MFQIFTFIYSSFTGIYDQLSVGLIAQLVEHCTGIAEVQIPFKPEFFYQAFFSQLLKLRSNYEDLSSI